MADANGGMLILGGTDRQVDYLRALLARGVAGSARPGAHPMGEDGLRALRTGDVEVAFVIESEDPEATFRFIREAASTRPAPSLIHVAREERPELAREAGEAGAVDCVPFGALDGIDLGRIVRYARDRREWRRSRAHVHALVNIAREVLSVVSPEGVVRYTSPSVEAILGFSPSEREGMNATAEVHPEDRSHVIDELRRVVADPDHRAHARYRMRHQDGSWRVHDAIAENHLDDPDIGGIAVSAWDVTDQIEHERRIRYQAELLDAVGQAVIATDLEGNVEYWNRAAEDLYGWRREDALGRHIVDLTVPPEARENAGAIMAELRERGRMSGELELRRKDGGRFLAYITNSPVYDDDGELVGIIGVSSDITALKETERALQERVKELGALYRVSQVMNQMGRPLGERLREAANGMPAGWLYPEITTVRISVGDLEAAGERFRETPWMQSAPISPSGDAIGRIEVALLEARPERDEGPFLDEERALLEGIAQIVGDAVERDRLTRLLGRTVASLEEAVIVLGNGDDGTPIRDVNPAAGRMFGYTRKELVSGEVELPQLFEDPQAFQRFSRNSLASIERTGVFRGAIHMRREDGTTFEAEQTVTLLDPEEEPTGGRVLTVRDVSARRRAEERFGVLSQEILDHIYVIGPDMRVKYSTPSVEKLTGLTREEFERLDTGELLDIIHPEDRDGVRESVRNLASHPGAVTTGQYRIVTTEGEVRHVEALVRNLMDNPVIEGLVITARDVTERMELEQRLRQGQKMEAVGRLSGGIAHDFNNILTVIRSQTDLLMMEPHDPDTLAGELEVIQSSVERAATLTSQLLAFSRDQILRPRTVDLSEIVRSMGELVDRIIGEDVELRIDLPEDLPPIEVDPNQLEQAVMNLAVNARDAMPSGGTLSLSAFREEEIRLPRLVEDDAPYGLRRTVLAVLKVSDTGTGMDDATRARIFEPFFTTKSKSEGTGLGLAMVYGFVEQSGGSIRVESRPGAGTKFFLSFPAATGAPTASQPPEPAPSPPRRLEGSVLLVEDDPAVQRTTRRILESAGLRVEAVEDAESGLELVEAGREFEMLLTDLVLPGMNGRELVARIRESVPEMPILVMSGYAEGPSGQELGLPDGVRFVQKPFTREELTGEVERTLQKSAS